MSKEWKDMDDKKKDKYNKLYNTQKEKYNLEKSKEGGTKGPLLKRKEPEGKKVAEKSNGVKRAKT